MTVYGLNTRTPDQRVELGQVGVIKAHDLSPAGNVTFVAGKTLADDSGWEQLAYIVLEPDGWESLKAEIDARIDAHAARVAVLEAERVEATS